MPQIPRYISKESLTREAPSGYMQSEQYGVMQDPAQAAQTSMGAAMQQIGQSLLAVKEKVQRVQNANDLFEAQVTAHNDFAVYLDEFNRADTKTAMDGIDSKLAATREKVSKIYVDPQAREAGLRQYNLDALQFKHKLTTLQAHRIIDLGKANTIKIIDGRLSAYIVAAPEEKVMIRTEIEALMDEAQAAQLFGEVEGDKLLESMIKSANAATKDVEALQKRREKELTLLVQQAKNAREEELVQMRVNGQVSLPELIKMANRDMNEGRIDAKFAETYINACKTPKLEKPTALESIIKYNELVEREAALLRKEKSWLNTGQVPFEDLTKFRADIFDARAKGHITDKQLKELLSNQSKTFYRDPVFQNALDQLAAHSSLYATSTEQARIKSEMYGSLITKVIAGSLPKDAVIEVIKERINTDINEVIEAKKSMPLEEDIEFTMKEMGLSRKEVLKRLGFE